MPRPRKSSWPKDPEGRSPYRTSGLLLKSAETAMSGKGMEVSQMKGIWKNTATQCSMCSQIRPWTKKQETLLGQLAKPEWGLWTGWQAWINGDLLMWNATHCCVEARPCLGARHPRLLGDETTYLHLPPQRFRRGQTSSIWPVAKETNALKW